MLSELDSNPTLKAFVSMGTTMEETRFHFADRAIQIYIEQECSKQNWQPKDFEPFIERINVTLYYLVAKYTQEISN